MLVRAAGEAAAAPAQPAADDTAGSQAAGNPAASDDYRNNGACTTGSQSFEAALGMSRQLSSAVELFTVERRDGGPSPILS